MGSRGQVEGGRAGGEGGRGEKGTNGRGAGDRRELDMGGGIRGTYGWVIMLKILGKVKHSSVQ